MRSVSDNLFLSQGIFRQKLITFQIKREVNTLFGQLSVSVRCTKRIHTKQYFSIAQHQNFLHSCYCTTNIVFLSIVLVSDSSSHCWSVWRKVCRMLASARTLSRSTRKRSKKFENHRWSLITENEGCPILPGNGNNT